MADVGAASGLPVPPTPLLGRTAERALAIDALACGRVVSLLGTGGVGKTRLALSVAHFVHGEVADGAHFVDLAPVTEPSEVVGAIARALGLGDIGPQPPEVTVEQYLAGRDILLVLDNMEHLRPAAFDIARLLERCAGLRVLATSRVSLRIPGEQQVPVHPLTVPDDATSTEELDRCPGTALFLDRARAADPGFTVPAGALRTVIDICARLDGLPLALELAAARVRAYGLEALRAELHDRFRVLELPHRPVPERHQALGTAVHWSVALLDEPAAELFARLSVFAGGCTAEAAQRVCADELRGVLPALATLVDHSLVVPVDTDHGMRYRMLETLREYAAELLTADERALMQSRLLAWCAELAHRLAHDSWGDDELTFIGRAEAEFHNIRVALEGAGPADTGEALRTAALLYRFWDGRGHLGEGRRHLRLLVNRPEAVDHPAERALALDALGMLTLWEDDHEGARVALAQSIATSERLGDLSRVAWSCSTLAISGFMSGEIDTAAPAGERAVALARTLDSPSTLSRAVCGLGLLRWSQGRREDAVVLLHEGLVLCEQLRFLWGRGKFTYFLGWFAFLTDDRTEADRLLRISAEAFLRLDERRSLPDTLDALGCLASDSGAHADALLLFAVTRRIRETAGSRRHTYLRPTCERAEETSRARVAPSTARRLAEEATRRPIPEVVRAALHTGTALPGALTQREAEVAELVTAGLTNRQIGRRLSISERTAERHVENLRAKIGVSSRAQVAAWFAGGPDRA